MTTSPNSAAINLALSEDPIQPAVAAPWIGPLVALGSRASRYKAKLDGDRQLIVALSVPQRDFAAVLIGCGWAMNSESPETRDPLELFRDLDLDTPVRVVTHNEVIADRFRGLDESRKPPRVRLSSSQWLVNGIQAAAQIGHELTDPVRMPRPAPGSLARLARIDGSWDARLAAPQADLAIVGTVKWLHEDVAAYLTREGEVVLPDGLEDVYRKADPKGRSSMRAGLGGTLDDILLVAARSRATWLARYYAASRMPDHLPLPKDICAAILDGSGAIRYLADIEVPIVVCILDRSVADETAADLIVQMRNSRGEPISLNEDLGWRPPAGIEALAFTVAL